MKKLVIEGGHKLQGDVPISGSKNAALPLLFASILMDGAVSLANIPTLDDIGTTLKVLENLGAETEFANGRANISFRRLDCEAPYELMRTMRAGILCMGPLLARTGRARVSLPGGCAIGARPVDQHLKALQKMGAELNLEEGYINASAKRLKGERIKFEMPTVGGTENLLMAAALADGETVLENAAMEPEIVDLANYLNACGAKIEGHGQSIIHVQGTDRLEPVAYAVMPDRIEAGTFLVAAAITGGRLRLLNCPVESIGAVLEILESMGLKTRADEGALEAWSDGQLECRDITTMPYPGFPTDMQAQLMALAALSAGEAHIEESIFENRFMHVQELLRMGADIKVSGRKARVRGVKRLGGAPVMASDLRASASLVLAGLAADGITEVSRIYHLDRGYEKMERKLNAVGANIKRVKA